MKKSLINIMGILWLFSISVSGATAAQDTSSCFLDVPSNSPYAYGICELKKRGIISGVDGVHFFPNTPVKRAEAFKIALGGKDISSSASTSNPFVDLPESHTLKSYVLYLYANRMISGYDATHVGPDNQLTLPESTKVVLNINGITPSSPVADRNWGLPPDSNLIPYLAESWDHNYIDDGDFSDNDGVMTRAKVADLMFRILYTKEHQLTSFQIGGKLIKHTYIGAAGTAVLSPDATQLLFEESVQDEPTQLVIVTRIDGTGIHTIDRINTASGGLEFISLRWVDSDTITYDQVIMNDLRTEATRFTYEIKVSTKEKREVRRLVIDLTKIIPPKN